MGSDCGHCLLRVEDVRRRLTVTEVAVVKQGALWSIGVVAGLLLITHVLRAVGIDRPALSPEGMVIGGS